MLGDLDRPAELVRIAARSAAAGNSAVRLQVLHSGPDRAGTATSTARPGARPDQLPGESGGDGLAAPLFGVEETRAPGPVEAADADTGRLDGFDGPHEEFLFSALRCRIEVTTWPEVRRDPREVTVFETGRLRGRKQGRRYVGTAVPNPGFLFENAQGVEVLLTYGARGWRPSIRDSLFLTAALSTLSHLAAHVAKAPILFMQTPVAPATEAAGDGSREAGRPANGHAIRLSVGVGRHQSDARIAFLDAVDRFAAEWGLSLYVGDRRVRRIRGEWSQVRAGDPATFSTARDTRFGVLPDDNPTRLVLATAVGPARVGSCHAIAALLQQEGIGVVSAAASSLSEMAVINMLLAVSPTAEDRIVRTSGGSVRSVEKGISQLRGICSLGDFTDTGGEFGGDLRPAAGYQLLRSEPYVAPPMAKPFDPLVGPYPLWAAWDLPASTLTQGQILDLLTDFLTAEDVEAEVAYARTRRVDDGRLRGRAKVALTLRPLARMETAVTLLRGLSERAEEYVRASLDANGLDPEECRLRITSRERWLGRWYLPV
ncbi:hypothetical protein ACI78Q_10530 [Geodermatophilus sp. SYSU D00705]